MQDLDDSSTVQLNFLNDPNNSINETAVSIDIGNEVQLQDKNHYAENALKQFYESQLKIHAELRFTELQKQTEIFANSIIAVYPPQPLVYFLPYTILVYQKCNLTKIRDKIREKYQPLIDSKELKLNMYVDTQQQLFISFHTSSELVYYKIRRLPISQNHHKYVDCLDKDILVDRLWSFYKTTYKKLLFEEVSVFILYWAYVKKFLNEEYLSPSAVKMMIICLFLDSGYGVDNVLNSWKKHFWKPQEKCLNMARTNRKGQCTIETQILNYLNYSIEQKKGLYIVSQKKYQIIPVISPILYPVGKRNMDSPYIFQYTQEEKDFYEKSAAKMITKLQNRQVPLTRYHLLFHLMKSLHKYFNYPNKLKFDIKMPGVIFQENSNEFLLEIQHPVFNHVISKGLVENGSTARRIKAQLNELVKKIKDNGDAIDNVIELFKRR